MKEDKKVPQLRFPEFTDAWKQRKVKELCSISTGKSNTQDKVDDGEYPFYVRSPIVERSKKYLYDEEAVLTVGDGVGTGKVFHYVNGKYDLHQRCYRMFNFSEELNAKYFYHIFSKMFYKRVMSMTAKTSVDSVRMDMIADMEIPVPNIKEQEKLGAFFSDIDNLITLHQRKLENTQNIKKSCLQKMFPKNGENLPEIRFPEFSGAWEQRKLGEVLTDLYNGQTPSRNNDSFWNGDVNWLSSGELNRGKVSSTIEKITIQGMEAAHLRMIPAGTFVMAITGLEAAGTRGNCCILDIDTTLNQSCMALFPKDGILSTSFLFQWYRLIGEEYGIRFTQGTKQQSYNAELIKDLDITLPGIEEQNKIASFLFKIDDLITLHQRKLENLQNIKKGLLQQMFI